MNKSLMFKQEEAYLNEVKQEASRKLIALEAIRPDAPSFSGRRNVTDTPVTDFVIGRRKEEITRCSSTLKDVAYYGRIDFRRQGENDSETFYIGKFPLYDVVSDLLIIEWQAPVASLYYQNGALRQASYICPDGNVTGEILVRREFDIHACVLRKVLDAGSGTGTRDNACGDSMLQEWLERNATGQMGEVVRSIQAEQDKIIRSNAKVVVVQGPAGSGKTVVALHRAAYLLYDMRKRRNSAGITASSVLVFSPNRIFASYIANVLPELGETMVRQTYLDDEILNDVTGRISEARRTFLKLRDDLSPIMGNTKAQYHFPSEDFVMVDEKVKGFEFSKALTDEVVYYRAVDERDSFGEKTGNKKKVVARRIPNHTVPEDVFVRLTEKQTTPILKTELKSEFLRSTLTNSSDTNRLRLSGARFKHSYGMMQAIEAFAEAISVDIINSLNAEVFPGAHRGVVQRAKEIAGKEFLQQAYSQASRKFFSPLERFRAVRASVQELVLSLKKSRTITPLTIEAVEAEGDRLAREILVWEARSPLDLYQSFWQNHATFTKIGNPGFNVPTLESIARDTIETIKNNRVRYEDLLPIAMLDGYCRGFSSFGNYLHAIVDEAQDYSPLHYAYLRQRLPDNCAFTIAGDINQAINGATSLDSYESLTQSMQQRTEVLYLGCNYRSTKEIVEFSRHILFDRPMIESVRVSGRKPKVIPIGNLSDGNNVLIQCLHNLREEGNQTIAVLTRTDLVADDLFKRMPRDMNARQLTENSDTLGRGVFVLPVYLSKGLEFDAVLLYDLSPETDDTEAERKLLYTACTRALHQLIVLYRDTPSPLLPLHDASLYEADSQFRGFLEPIK